MGRGWAYEQRPDHRCPHHSILVAPACPSKAVRYHLTDTIPAGSKVTLDQLVFPAEIVLCLACAATFTVAVTGRQGFNGWETRNLNRVALLTGLAAAVLCVMMLVQAASPTP